jgi:phospholipid N-methyltransferase
MSEFTATYSPEDNKLRLYALSRLPKDLYERVRAAGFIWAPKQELFVAPMWTPEREDLLIELAGEIGDEDTGLVDRAEQRAERFEDYSDSRAQDAESARKAVSAIADGIPMGQPILVGHHSERRARKDAERIENGMRRAVKMWEQSQYWQDRARGAIRAAKYKERPDVRARRIKKIEAEKRSREREKAQAEATLKVWTNPEKELTYARALALANSSRCWFSRCYPLAQFPRSLPASQYEGDMGLWSALGRSDGPEFAIITPEQARAYVVACCTRVVERSTRWLMHYANRLEYERAMLAEDGGTVADHTGPEVGGACRCWCNQGWSKIQKVNKVSVTLLDNWGNGGRDFTRTIPFDKLAGVMTKAEVDEARAAGRLVGETSRSFHLADGMPEPRPICKPPEPNEFDAMRDTLKAGIQVVSAPQLFPTPPALAERMAELAELTAGDTVLEPSAGTGNIVKAIRSRGIFRDHCTAVEINRQLAEMLQAHTGKVFCADFLACNGNLGTFDRILMNPPFERGEDIKHIKHALTMLKPGGRLVAICANGPRQREALQPLASTWIDLEPGTFKESGTDVNAALLVINLIL